MGPSPRPALAPATLAGLVGDVITGVESRGKHLLIGLSSERVIHSHMRMDGSWHVYPAGGRWQQPASAARLVLETGDRIAVCFSAPVVELLRSRELAVHPALRALGPDVLAADVDMVEIRARVALRPSTTLIGDLLLDQQVASGIGNIWRCEALFLVGVHPTAPIGSVPEAVRDEAFRTAGRLMRSRTDLADQPATDRWVYGRAGRPCRRCRQLVRSARIGTAARTAYWCPGCQPEPA